MEERNLTGIIPEQYTGREIIAEESKKFETTEEAKAFYQQAKERLMDVNRWSETGSLPGTSFRLLDADAEEADRPVQQGDYFRISIPGPGTKEGDGYDWVYVEELSEVEEEDAQSIAFRVRPTSNPESPSSETAHFYSEESTSSFILTRQGATVTASVVDRNIKANDDASSMGDKIRDKVYALGGITGMSKLQWNSLVKGVVGE